MFELTDTLTYAVPVMLSVLVAKTVADALEPKGIYDLVIELSQLPYLDAKHDYVWGSYQISDVVSHNVPHSSSGSAHGRRADGPRRRGHPARPAEYRQVAPRPAAETRRWSERLAAILVNYSLMEGE